MAEQPITPGNHITEEAVRLLADFGITTGLTFDPTFALDQIAEKAQTEQVRTTLIDPDHLAGITEAMREDLTRTGTLDRWPALLVWKRSKTKYDVLNGLHRTAAARQVNQATFAAVIVDLSNEPDPALLAQSIKVAANLRNGLPMTREEKVANAVHLYKSGIGGARAAKVAGIAKSTLHHYLNYDLVVQRMGHAGFGGYVGDFTQQALLAAAKITNEAPFREAITLARKAALTGPEQVELFTKVAALKDQTRQMAHLDAEATRLANRRQAVANGTATAPVLSTAAKARRDLSRLLNNKFNPDLVLGLFTTPAARAEAVADLREQRALLDKSIRVLERADKATTRSTRATRPNGAPAPAKVLAGAAR